VEHLQWWGRRSKVRQQDSSDRHAV
jgi:hypothetical protein